MKEPIDIIINEEINRHILQETWYDPSSWFKKPQQEPQVSPEELRRREIQRGEIQRRKDMCSPYLDKLYSFYECIINGKQTRYLDCGNGQGEQSYTLFDSFVSSLISLTEGYVHYGSINQSNYEYWQNKIPTIIDMLSAIKEKNPYYSPNDDLPKQIDNAIQWCVNYYNAMKTTLK